MNGTFSRLIRRTVDVKEQEFAALLWSAAYFFFVLCAYYVLRPIRDEAGVAGGVENLPWLFTGTLVGMLLVHPIFASLVSRLPRRRFVPLTYRFFILHLGIFYVLYRFTDPAKDVWIGRVFFIWGSIFNLFVVSVFWSFMTDIFRSGQSKRLFGMVAVGGTIGAITGSSITSALAAPLGPVNLLLVSALLLELACFASKALERHEAALATAADEEDIGEAKGSSDELIGGSFFDGIKSVVASPYLLGISGLMLFFTISSTFIYFQQADIISQVFGDDRTARTKLFANRDLAVNVLTLLTQLFLTGRVVRWFGIGVALAFVPALGIAGFALLGASPVLSVVLIFDVLRRAANFAIQRPAREALYTVLPRSDKYKAKNFNDTFVYRAGDQIGAWSYPAMGALGLSMSGLSYSMIPLSILWLALALWLGRKYLRLHRSPAPGHEST
ncbi:MFS transporter [Luteolibacter sp. GHJ8]|uniref:MFS transporter n=1 Tax=Luteolibacter rhizosphaerae TaxID=2989719 RepID=A0ABT3G3H0_9BACT|nr:MFS transporter [Luteolibacter rhizosphaerae]MCW1914381.1 MFS transporter [Luteolibacter rhizosphaerae]